MSRSRVTMGEQYDRANYSQTGKGILALLLFCYRPWHMLWTVTGTMGKRVVDDAKEAFTSLAVMCVWLAFFGSAVLVPAVLVAVVVQLVHRARPAGPDVHSKSVGRSRVAKLLKCKQSAGRTLEGFLGIGLGLVAMDAGDPALGSLLCAMGTSSMVVYAMVRTREAAMDQDMMDAVIQQQAQQQRLRDLLNNH